MAAIVEDGKLRLSGYVGDYYFEDGFTSSDVVVALAQIDRDSELDVHINSAGGIASEGAAIHALLSARPGTTNVVVEGIAASAASLIAMAGATVTMSAGSIMMIHDPSGMTWGTSDDHAKSIEGLEALATAYARVYADKSGKTAAECREIMKAERWFTPEQAVEGGFADATTEGRKAAVAAFDYRLFANAPKRLVALAKSKAWRLPDTEMPAQSAGKPSQKENTMTDKEHADAIAAAVATAVKADRERRAAIMALDETKGREVLAEHLAGKGESVEDAKATLAASPKAAPVAAADPSAYDAHRVTASGQALPQGDKKPEGAAAGWAKAAETINKRRG